MRSRLLALALAFALPSAVMAQTLRVGLIAQDMGTTDPHRASATQDKAPLAWAYDGLVRFPPGSADPAKLEPDLAESFTRSADGLSFTFRLRPGIRFHDGTAMEAEDVVFSLRRAADRARSAFSGDYAPVTAIEVLDPMTVRVTLRQAVAGALGLFANYHGGMIVSRRADAGGQAPGTGPFRLERAGGGAARMVAHDAHWRGRPAIRAIDLRFITSDATRELAFTAGELDLFIGRREQRWVERMRAHPNTVVEVFSPGEFRTLLISSRSAPLNDPRVRRAVQHAIDAPGIARFVGLDVATPWVSPVPPGYLGATEDVPRYPHDLARARALLAEAGHPDGVTIRAVVSSNSAQQPIMEVVQAQLRRANIRLDMEVVEHATYHARIRQDLSQLTFYGAARYPVADSYLSQFYHSRSAPGQPTMSLNFAHCSAADAEIDAARAEPDEARQLALWATAQRKVMEAGCSLPLFDLKQVWVRRAGLNLGYRLEGSLNLGPAITAATRLD
ncbi:ABC transporter substrate-binding protein [Falsiroseomonas tokyonensis]|uniref:ABC transporter substrate-binding protein n=1 Tax=Falsiroseomonas tokyonensis TaxID=430521 RepID=A0ABV7C0B2_9PROT|nr:ABC transporter substrate-binding protein [Falsiroseomonas tokyonensis]MBU8541324.1 polyamine ABC transporter substrate-binding protein [Falsiroseomonas tokyonensis]